MATREARMFETRTYKVGGEMGEMARMAKEAGATDDEQHQIMEAARNLNDIMRTVRRRLLEEGA